MSTGRLWRYVRSQIIERFEKNKVLESDDSEEYEEFGREKHVNEVYSRTRRGIKEKQEKQQRKQKEKLDDAHSLS